MATDKPNLNLKVIGSTGLPVWSGRVFDEILPDLMGDRGRRIFREMSEQDPIIGGILLGVEMLARQVNWSIKPADDTDKAKEVAEFMDGALTDMHPTFGSTLSEIVSMLPYGWSWLEIIYKKRKGLDMNDNVKSSMFDDNKIGWGGWQIRSQETLFEWEFNNERNVNAVNASRGPLTAMIQRGVPDFTEYRIPRSKSLHFVTRSRRENPEGISFLRNAYRPWYMKKNIEMIEGIGVERDLAGMPVIWAPEELFSSESTPEQKNLLAMLQKIVTSIKRDEQEGLLMPMAYTDDGKNPSYKLELLSTAGDRQFDTSGIISRYDERIAMSMLADFILMGHQAVGSFALGATKTNLFSTAMSAILDVIADEINSQAFPKLTVLNGWPLKMTPTLQHGKVEAADMSKLADFLNQLNAAGMQIFPNKTLEKFLLESAGMPGSDEISEAGEYPIDPLTGEPIVPQIDPLTGQPMLPAPAGPNPGTSPNNKSDKGARPQAPRDIAIRRETARAAKPAAIRTQGKAATEPDEPDAIKANTTTRQRHFIPLPNRVNKVASKLQEALGPEEYKVLLSEVMELGKFTKLKRQYQEAILKAEGRYTEAVHHQQR